MVQDFFMAALPWIVMGLSAGIILGAVAAAAKAKNEGKTVNTTPTYFMVGVLWSIVALLELIGSTPSISKGTTYLILGCFFFVLGIIENRKNKP